MRRVGHNSDHCLDVYSFFYMLWSLEWGVECWEKWVKYRRQERKIISHSSGLAVEWLLINLCGQQDSDPPAQTKFNSAYVSAFVLLPRCCIRDSLVSKVIEINLLFLFYPWVCAGPRCLPVPIHTTLILHIFKMAWNCLLWFFHVYSLSLSAIKLTQ